ncbi:MAG: excinuclease ABC subunit C [Opitutaceae bacterium]|nr:excinuclease ABC subunit C [Opitutaceae bacterium]
MPRPDQSKLKKKVRQLPHRPGIYMMKDQLGSVIYVGKAKDLKKRVSTYFQPSRKRIQHPKIRNLVKVIHDFETFEVKTETEAILLEGKLIKQWKPKYNTDFVDDKRFLLIRLDLGAQFPKFQLVRNQRDDTARYFGPFAYSGLLRKTLAEMRLKFGILLNDTTPKLQEDGRYRLYDDIRGEIYGHANLVTEEDYAKRLDAACTFLEGKAKEWLAELKETMQQSAAGQDYERAAELRDVVAALEKTISNDRRFKRTPALVSDSGYGMTQLRKVLELGALPRHIESFDISHISGTFVVASMVRFQSGRPATNQYRRFKIKSFVGNDDFRAMEEVVGRRYRRLHEERKVFPDLIVIDGGAGQVSAAIKAFMILDLEPPPLIGLAKKKETIIFPDERKPMNLMPQSPALKLLQRIRDEAHRFANTFNAQLRTKKIRESILDEFSGLGPVRREELMGHFGSIDRLRKASVEELRTVPGFGSKLSEQLWEFLQRSFKKPRNRYM